MKKNGIRYITTTAMMTAVSVVIGIFCKSFLNFGAGVFRITFENLPIILSGIIMGPVTGGIVGLSSDMVSYFMSPQTYPPNLVVTLGATVIGILSGIVPRTLVKKKGRTQIIVTGVIAHTVGSLIIKTAGLFQYYQWLVLLRIPLYMIIAPLEIFVICILLRNRSFAKLVGYVRL